ncbi:MAG TPA: hypothetical protein VFZ41_07765 [Solirubrobacterales bacterium]
MASLCAERGYAETTREQVIERSGISPEFFDELFAKKENCGAAAIDAILAEVMTTFAAGYSADLPGRDGALLGIRAILELLAARPAFASLTFICARQMAPPRLKEGLETGARMLAAMLERLGEDAGGSPLSPRAARAALGGVEAVVRREIMAGRAAELPRLLPDFVYAATVPTLGQEEALQLAARGRALLEGTAWG